jgi:hypothetical protein
LALRAAPEFSYQQVMNIRCEFSPLPSRWASGGERRNALCRFMPRRDFADALINFFKNEPPAGQFLLKRA